MEVMSMKISTDDAPTESFKRTTENRALAEYAKLLREKYITNKKVLLIQTLQLQLDSFNVDVAKNKGYYAFPPAGLQYLARGLEARGFEVDILDLNYEFLKRVNEDDSFHYLQWLDIVDSALSKKDYSVVGVGCIGVSTDLFNPTHPLTGVLKHLKSKERYVVLAGGTLAVNEYENYLMHNVCHFVVEGEGENKIGFLFDHLYKESFSRSSTPGIYFKANGRIEETAGPPDIVSPAGNLVSAYRHVPIEDYNRVGSLNPFSRMIGQEKHFTGILLNRGCRANCKFCGVPRFMGKGVRQTPIDELYEELVYLIEKRNVRHFELLDDDFLGPKDLRNGVEELLERMSYLKEKYGISWAAGNGLIAGSVNERLMRLIHDSGCVGFRIGIESGNPEMLKRMRKPASIHSLKKFVGFLEAYPDIFVAGNYIIGLFGDETFGQMLDTYHFSCEIDLDWASYSTYQFTSPKTNAVENLKSDGKAADEFVPVKDTATRELKQTAGIKVGTDVFSIPKDSVPSRDQIKEIWFVFNLLSNYIHNKNLRPGGNPKKLLAWLKAIQVTYPHNPYMPLFAGYCHILLNEPTQAREELVKTENNLRNSQYWNERFAQFQLFDLMGRFPRSAEDVYENLDRIRVQFNNEQTLSSIARALDGLNAHCAKAFSD